MKSEDVGKKVSGTVVNKEEWARTRVSLEDFAAFVKKLFYKILKK